MNLFSGISSRVKAIILFLLLPAGINEFLVGATPLQAILANPLLIPFALGFYGAGVLALREIAVRMKKGVFSLFILGMGFGILLEGLVARTIFSTANAQVGVLATYGNWLGVNWVWAALVILGNGFFTVLLPALFVDLLYPETKGVPLLSKRELAIGAALLVGFPLAANIAGPPYVPLPHLAITIAALILLFAAAKMIPDSPPAFLLPAGEPARAPFFFIAGLLFNLFLFAVPNGIPVRSPPLAAIALLCVGYALVWSYVMPRLIGDAKERPLLAFLFGILFFFFLIDVLRFFQGDFLIIIVAILFSALLWTTRRRVHRLPQSKPSGNALPE